MITLAAFFLLVIPAAQAQERVNRDAFYNSTEGFHVLIPTGWENRSSESFAHFYQSEAQVSIYAISVPTTDVQAGIEQAIERVLPDLEVEPITSEVILSNGTWTQNIYLPVDDSPTGRISAYGQVYTGNTYVILWHTDAIITLAQPVIVPGEDVQAGIVAALNLTGTAPEDIFSTEERTFDGVTWTYNVYDSTPSIQVSFSTLGRVSGDNTLVLANVTGRTPFVALPVFFDLLTGFFITPATTPYLYLGLAATAVITVLFLGMMLLRYRSLRKDLETLESLESGERATA